ncbi:DUF4870 domain-containing protein [soil metagenome]
MTESTPAPAAATPLSEADDKLWASLAHFGNILSFLAPLLIWLLLKDRGAKVAVEGKEALNWGINATGALIISFILGLIPFLGLIFLLVNFAVLIVNLIFAIMGGIKVQQGGSYRYPINIRWIK